MFSFVFLFVFFAFVFRDQCCKTVFPHVEIVFVPSLVALPMHDDRVTYLYKILCVTFIFFKSFLTYFLIIR